MKIARFGSLAISSYLMAGDGCVPNSALAALIFHKAIDFEKVGSSQAADQIERVIRENDWYLDWIDSVYRKTHYHSTAHEVLVIFKGKATLQLGGRKSLNVRPVEPGDIVVIPAGVGHKRIDSTDDFTVFGLYPRDQTWDLQWGYKKNYQDSIVRIEKLITPEKDPFYGKEEGLKRYWWGSGPRN